MDNDRLTVLSRECRMLEAELRRCKAKLTGLSEGGRAGLRAVERAEYEQRIEALAKENKALQREAAVYKAQLAKFHRDQLMGTDREQHHQNHPVPPAAPGILHDRGISDELHRAYEREGRARMAWLDSVEEARAESRRVPRQPQPRGASTSPSRSPGRRPSSPPRRTHGAEQAQALAEGEAMVKALSQELLKRNGDLAEARSQVTALHDAAAALQRKLEDTEHKSRELSLELQRQQAEVAESEARRRKLQADMQFERFARREDEDKDAAIAELRAEVASLEAEARQLTLQSIQSIWRGGVSQSNRGVAAPPASSGSSSTPAGGVTFAHGPPNAGAPGPFGRTASGTAAGPSVSAIRANPSTAAVASKVQRTVPQRSAGKSEHPDEFVDRIARELMARFDGKKALFGWLDQVSSGRKDRKISLSDFQTGMSKLLSLTAKQSKVVFDAADVDGSGSIDYAELGKLYERGGLPVAPAPLFAPTAPLKDVVKPVPEDSVAEEIAEEIEEEIFPRSSSFGGGRWGGCGGDDEDEGDRDTRMGSQSFVSVDSVDSMEQSIDNAASRSGWASGEVSGVFLTLDAASVSIFSERAWLLESLQDLYKMFRGKHGTDRATFLDKVSRVLAPLDEEVQELRAQLGRMDGVFEQKLQLETQALSRALEEFKRDRLRLENACNLLNAKLERASAKYAELYQRHSDLMDVLRMLSLSAVERQRIMAGERVGLVGDALGVAANANTTKLEGRLQELERERDRFREAYDILLQFWGVLPKEERREAAMRLGRHDLNHAQVNEGGRLDIKRGTVRVLLEARFGAPSEPVDSWKDVTETVRVMMVDGGITNVHVTDELFTGTGLGVFQRTQSGGIARTALGNFLLADDGTKGGSFKKASFQRGRGDPAAKGDDPASSELKSLVVKYVRSDGCAALGAQSRELTRDERRMASDALAKLAQLMDRWGVGAEELMFEFSGAKNEGGHGAEKGIRWEHFMQVLGEMPVEIGGEGEIRDSLRMRAEDKFVNSDVLRSRLEAHYWFLVSKGLRSYVGKTSIVTLAPGNILARRQNHIGEPGWGAAMRDLAVRDEEHAASAISDLEKRYTEAEGRAASLALYAQSLQIALGIERAYSDGFVSGEGIEKPPR